MPRTRPSSQGQPERDGQHSTQTCVSPCPQYVSPYRVLEGERRSRPEQQQPDVPGGTAQQREQGACECSGCPAKPPRPTGCGAREGRTGDVGEAAADTRPAGDEQDLEDDEGVLLDGHGAEASDDLVRVVAPDPTTYEVVVPGGRPEQRSRKEQDGGDIPPSSPSTPVNDDQDSEGDDEGQQVEQRVAHRCKAC